MRLPFFIARKYFLSRENTGAINIMSWVSMTGMAIGTMSLIVVLSVFNGFEGLIHELYGSFYPDIIVKPARGKTFVPPSQKVDSLKHLPQVAYVSRVIEENALLKYKDQQHIGTIKGVDNQYIHVTDIEDHLIAGEYKLYGDNQSYAILGSGVKARLGVNFDNLFHPINVYVPKRERTYSLIRSQAFYHEPIYGAGAFSIQQDFDLEYAIVPIDFAHNLLEYDQQISALEIKLDTATSMDDGKQAIEELFPRETYTVQTRIEQNQFLYQIMQAERWAVYCILTFILLLLAFNMVGCLTMLVIEKQDDITILKSMGAPNQLVRRIFLSEGLLLGGIGGAIGALLAVGLCLLQEYGEILTISGSGSFVISAYPVDMHYRDFILVLGTVLGIALLASWYPSYKAAQQTEGIHELE